MSQPTFFGEGYTPRPKDTLWRVRAKILGYYQSQAGADPANDPKPHDTRYWQKRKILQSLNGT